jgi:transposase
MTIIRQGSLFDMQDLYEIEPSKRFEAVFETLHIEPLLFAVNKKSIYGVPTELNYPAMIYALVVRILERIPTTKDLINRLKHDFMFRLDLTTIQK